MKPINAKQTRTKYWEGNKKHCGRKKKHLAGKKRHCAGIIKHPTAKTYTWQDSGDCQYLHVPLCLFGFCVNICKKHVFFRKNTFVCVLTVGVKTLAEVRFILGSVFISSSVIGDRRKKHFIRGRRRKLVYLQI